MTTLARTERLALADLLDEVGPDAPTLCGGWTARDLAAHLVVRERRIDASPGIAVRALAGHLASVQRSYAERPYGELVHLVRTGPGRLSPFSLPGVDKIVNTTEYVVHHEDVRRAQRGWQPRGLPAKVQDAIWKAVTARAPFTLRGLACRVELRRTDQPEASPFRHGSGDGTVVLAGAPMELLLYVFGRRDHAKVEVSGDPEAVAALARHSLAA